MKILLSAYACEPNKGSEPAVGWNWMLCLVNQGHQVFVITRSNNRSVIETVVEQQRIAASFIYYDLPKWCTRWKHLPGGLYFYYLFWQLGAYLRTRKIHDIQQFDVVHHITFVTFRQPSFMGGLNIPFIFGPVGGGETSPPSLRKGFYAPGKLREFIRDLLISATKFDPLMNSTFSKASLIACTTAQTRDRIPARFHAKCVILPAIGTNPPFDAQVPLVTSQCHSFLFVGRLLYWKGLHFVLRAMPAVLKQIPNARLRVIGEGNDEKWLRKIATECGISTQVDWIGALPQSSVSLEYRNHVALVFPSLHDSGGFVILESLSAGVPVICLALGGPGNLVDDSCGVAIETANQSEEEIEQSIAMAMIALIAKSEMRASLMGNCRARAQHFSWDNTVQELYNSFKLSTLHDD